MWYLRINLLFINEGIYGSQMDHSSYIKQTCELLLVIILYVDDFIILASDIARLK